MGIVSRLTEPEARKIIFDKVEKQATGVSELKSAKSVINVNAAQCLLAEEFNIIFREFHEFLLISGKLGRYLSHEQINNFKASGESEEKLTEQMPIIINEVMKKILLRSTSTGNHASEESKE